MFHLSNSVSVELSALNNHLPIWIESTYKDDDGTLYGAYHYEPYDVCFSNSGSPTVPKISWLRSIDNGLSWEDLGFVLTANQDPSAIRCDTKSSWFAGGNGDFSVILDHKKEYFYIVFSSYVKEFAEQGIGLARLRYADRDAPSGKVRKWHNGEWNEPGLGGHITPIFPAKIDFHQKNADFVWGPAIHWNTYLSTYVILLNHAIDSAMNQEGIYITYNSDLANPIGWSEPQKILGREEIKKAMAGASIYPWPLERAWYPEVIGTAKGETDKLVGRTGRFFLWGVSRFEITFLKPGEKSQ